MASTDEQGTSYEAEHVHSVYEQIASHFSSTRYKVYNHLSPFLASQTR
jgi:tRNA (uracil-5-)-methyltransferase TRM9